MVRSLAELAYGLLFPLDRVFFGWSLAIGGRGSPCQPHPAGGAGSTGRDPCGPVPPQPRRLLEAPELSLGQGHHTVVREMPRMENFSLNI